MKRFFDETYRWVYYVAVGFLFLACLLRSILMYQQNDLRKALIFLVIWAGLFFVELVITPRWRYFFYLYLLLQTGLIFLMVYTQLDSDFFSVLYAILGMQIMQVIKPSLSVVIIGLFTPLTAISLTKIYGIGQILPLAFVYLAANALLSSYAYLSKQTIETRERNQKLLVELQNANYQLQTYADEVKGLSVARERNRLARELHDSVTQTIFSMTLTTQSARLLLKKDPLRVNEQLERLNQLALNVQNEMHQLINQLSPMKYGRKGLAAQLREHIQNRYLPEYLSVSLEVTGEKPLKLAEEQNLFRIVQEALNNTVKHTKSNNAFVRLHLDEPFWVEVEDQGQGFDLTKHDDRPGVGLASMRERAEGIGWKLSIRSSPGKGTIVTVEKGLHQRGKKHG
jgi:signal transduction histidine kinase